MMKICHFQGLCHWVGCMAGVLKVFVPGFSLSFSHPQPFQNRWKWSVAGRSTYILAYSIATTPDSDINQTAGSSEWSSEYVRKLMHACRSVYVACRPAETRQRRGGIGWIQPNGHKRVNKFPETSSLLALTILGGPLETLLWSGFWTVVGTLSTPSVWGITWFQWSIQICKQD